MSRTWVVMAAVACMGLAACTERPQTAAHHKADGHAYEGPATASAYTAPGWKPGDETSWETQMRTRSQGQDEYSRAGAK